MIYKRTLTKVITAVWKTENFEAFVVLHQGSALSPFLFVLAMDVLSEAIRYKELWELLYADDLVITSENGEDIQRRVGDWHESLERGGLKVNVNKTGFAEQFKDLGSSLGQEGRCEAEVDSRIKAAWGKWRKVAGVVCDKKMSIKLKVKRYNTVIRPVLLYGAETWALRRKEEVKIEKTEMRCLDGL
ncbi:uncharacterized protein LOC135209017 [Macrobrachium nipponense]|uniref:uncharacterized protein LOC135209017 n=1 Tax=Macrobrachium nipponense TaxID=159736 RepID=UPI0030C8963B